MKKSEIDLKIRQIAKASKKTIKAGGDWPVGGKKKIKLGDDDWPVGEMPEPPKGNITGDWPLGFVLRTKPEIELFSKKVVQHFGVKPRFSKSTKLTDIAARVHSLKDKKKI